MVCCANVAEGIQPQPPNLPPYTPHHQLSTLPCLSINKLSGASAEREFASPHRQHSLFMFACVARTQPPQPIPGLHSHLPAYPPPHTTHPPPTTSLPTHARTRFSLFICLLALRAAACTRPNMRRWCSRARIMRHKPQYIHVYVHVLLCPGECVCDLYACVLVMLTMQRQKQPPPPPSTTDRRLRLQRR